MYRFLLFIKTIYTVLLFVALEAVAVYIFFSSNPYHKALAINASNVVMASIYSGASGTVNFFSLSSQNEHLAQENAFLREQLSRRVLNDTIEDAEFIEDKYIAARIINNSITGQNNFITINKGWADGIEKDMALLDNHGIVGYVLECSENLAVAISVLNFRDFRTIGKVKDSDNTGKISWNGHNHRVVQFTGVPKYAKLKIGDTVLTQYSNIFPDNYPIGVVRNFSLENGTSYNVDVILFTDMSVVKYVYAVQNPLQKERSELENKTINNAENN